jgi:hypothetical protein
MMRFRFFACALVASASVSGAQRDTAPVKRPFIGRILGVFDMMTGDPIEGVEVLDVKTKSWAVTTATGTVALSFVDSTGGIVRLRKVGFEPQMLTLTNYSDEGAVTAVLTRSGVALPTVTTTATRVRGVADTSRKLEMSGYYDRRDKGGAAPMAFVPGEKVQGILSFDDFERLTGRPICEGNLYVDGIRVKGADMMDVGGLRGRNPIRTTRKNIADQFVQPANVLAIENYRTAEVPVEYNQTKNRDAMETQTRGRNAQTDCGATLIWTK